MKRLFCTILMYGFCFVLGYSGTATDVLCNRFPTFRPCQEFLQQHTDKYPSAPLPNVVHGTAGRQNTAHAAYHSPARSMPNAVPQALSSGTSNYNNYPPPPGMSWSPYAINAAAFGNPNASPNPVNLNQAKHQSRPQPPVSIFNPTAGAPSVSSQQPIAPSSLVKPSIPFNQMPQTKPLITAPSGGFGSLPSGNGPLSNFGGSPLSGFGGGPLSGFGGSPSMPSQFGGNVPGGIGIGQSLNAPFFSGNRGVNISPTEGVVSGSQLNAAGIGVGSMSSVNFGGLPGLNMLNSGAIPGLGPGIPFLGNGMGVSSGMGIGRR